MECDDSIVVIIDSGNEAVLIEAFRDLDLMGKKKGRKILL